jgi:adenine-specific DNA methylase
LIEASSVAASIDVPDKVRNRIQLAVAGASEMAGHLSRWDRFHPKAFEALANHRYSSTSLAVETNLLGSRGRGTLARRLASSVAAARWMNDQFKPGTPDAITVVTGSSATQKLGDRVAALILTDPPYYDAVQYGELSALFRVWGSVTKAALDWTFNSSCEAIPRASEAVGYEATLQTIFKEAARTLADDGRLLLTFHSTDFRGWTALGHALNCAGFCVVALGVGHSENEKDHGKRGKLAFSRDLVIECTKRQAGARRAPPLIVNVPHTAEQRELLAAGCAIATKADGGTVAMVEAFEDAVARLKTRRIAISEVQRREP